MNDNNSLAHTTWNCKYHIVFAPKYRRRAIYGKIRADIGRIIRMLCERKGVNIIEAELCPATCICLWRYRQSIASRISSATSRERVL